MSEVDILDVNNGASGINAIDKRLFRKAHRAERRHSTRRPLPHCTQPTHPRPNSTSNPSTPDTVALTSFIMPAPTNTLLIEGSFEELVEELAQYLVSLRNRAAGPHRADGCR